MEECWRRGAWVAVDSEGGGSTLQMSMFSSRGLASFIFTGGFLTDEVHELIWDVVPVVFGNKSELGRYLGGTGGCSQMDPLLILRDIPGMGTEVFLKGVARAVLGVDIDRIKNLASLHMKNSFTQMTDKELLFGKVRVSDWAKENISSDQAFYGCLDTEVTLRAIRIAMWLELGMRSYESCLGEVDFDKFL